MLINNCRIPIRVAILCSTHAPGLTHLLMRCPDRGTSFEIVCALTTETTFREDIGRGIPRLTHPIREFYESRGASLYRDFDTRRAYDAEAVRLIARHQPDLIVLDGYLYVITAPLLDAFTHRIVNLHYSDLTVRDGDGAPRFPGVRAVRDALAAGCAETHATVHLADARPDAGAPIVRSWAFPASPLVAELRPMDAGDAFNAYAFAHQQWMMRTASGPLLAAALKLIATGAVDLDELAHASPREIRPWLLDRSGALLAPEVELV